MASQPLIVILGPTASGKSEIAIKLAKKFNGEIVNADSRQIYKGMDIGTNKIQNSKFKIQNYKSKVKSQKYLINGIFHHLIDIIYPNQEFSVAQYKRLAIKTIREIHKRGKLPFLVGGTGLYIKAVADNLKIPKVPPNKKLRQKLEKLELLELLKILKSKDPQTFKQIDKKNKRRIIRALEVIMTTNQSFWKSRQIGKPLFDVLQIGIRRVPQRLNKKINQRVEKMIQAGLVDEVKTLAKKYSFILPSMSGIGYQEIGQYLKGEITLGKAKELIKQRTRQYAKRQMTWFKRDQRIHWVQNLLEARKLIRQFLRQ